MVNFNSTAGGGLGREPRVLRSLCSSLTLQDRGGSEGCGSTRPLAPSPQPFLHPGTRVPASLPAPREA